MIITLTGADFSASNIGTLSTWRITRSLGMGATYAGATSVDKGAVFMATITISDGYDIGSEGVTVTMGGVDQDYTMSGNTITIYIVAVTGNIVIKVPTINLSTGEEDSGGSNDTTVNGVPIAFNWMDVGAIIAASGKVSSTREWIYSDFVNIAGYSYLGIQMIQTTSGNTDKGLAFYDENQTYITGSGITNNIGASSMTPQLRNIQIPSGAVYVRTTWISEENPKYNGGCDKSVFSCVAYTEQSESGGGTTVNPVGQDITELFSWTDGYRVITDGSTPADSNWRSSNFVDVSAYKTLHVMLPTTPVSNSTSGCAFYRADQSLVKGINIKTVVSKYGYELTTIGVPDEAVYFKTMWYADGHAARHNITQSFICTAEV